MKLSVWYLVVLVRVLNMTYACLWDVLKAPLGSPFNFTPVAKRRITSVKHTDVLRSVIFSPPYTGLKQPSNRGLMG